MKMLADNWKPLSIWGNLESLKGGEIKNASYHASEPSNYVLKGAGF